MTLGVDHAGPAPAHGRIANLASQLLVLSPLGVLVFVLAVLAAALFAQYVLGLAPCILCLAERVPFAIGGGLAVLALGRARLRGRLRWFEGLCALVFLVSAGLAAYHVGVEQHWWVSAVDCTGPGALDLSVSDLRGSALDALPPCDQVPGTILGLSLAAWNAVASAMAAAFFIIAPRLAGTDSQP